MTATLAYAETVSAALKINLEVTQLQGDLQGVLLLGDKIQIDNSGDEPTLSIAHMGLHKIKAPAMITQIDDELTCTARITFTTFDGSSIGESEVTITIDEVFSESITADIELMAPWHEGDVKPSFSPTGFGRLGSSKAYP